MTVDRDRLERLQTLFVRLLFCDATLEKYRSDPDGLAAEFGLPHEALGDLPDPDGAQMTAERHGRRTGVMRELKACFTNAMPVLEQLTGFDVEAFLCSDAFYDPGSGLPHPYGVGAGYENSSKFFFWLKGVLTLDAPGVPIQLRTMIYGDFASYLVGQCTDRALDYYKRFADGVYWRESPAAPLPLMYMTAERHFFRYEMEEQRAELLRLGAADLDALRPEPSKRRANIK